MAKRAPRTKAPSPETPDPVLHKNFEADVSRVLHLVVHSLYSHKEIFLRELISNASDAIDRLRVRQLHEPDLADEAPFEIRVQTDKDAATLTIEDNGCGMSKDELIRHLGTIAHSGTLEFLANAKDRGDGKFIGQFGVGFYSAFLVADRVRVVSRPAGSEEAWAWSSDGIQGFTVEPADRASRGTSITLHLKADQHEFLDTWRLRDLVERWSDFVRHPILLAGPDKDGEKTWERANRSEALWQRPKDEVGDDQYREFYKHLASDWEDPLCWAHFRIEGTQLFTGLLFVPSRPPVDLFTPGGKRGVKLYVNRVFVLEDVEELVPPWLRFLRGVVDSDDLPLNVSRELLQDSAVTRTIKKQVVKKALERFEKLAEDDPAAWDKLWTAYGAVLKEGLYLDREHKDKLGRLVRFRSSAQDGLTTLDGYVERMKEGQDTIWYVAGDSLAAVRSSPHIEALKRRGVEVLLLTDPVDPWAIDGLREWGDKKLKNAAEAEIDAEEGQKEAREKHEGELKDLLARMKDVLADSVSAVRVSSRLADSPACLVGEEGGQPAWMERVMRMQDPSMPVRKRVLEVNAEHPLLRSLDALRQKEGADDRFVEWVEMLYDQALLSEGSPVDDPARLARRMTRLMEKAAREEAGNGEATA